MKIRETLQKNKPNLLFKFLIFEPKIDDTKLYKIMQNKANLKIDLMSVTKVLTRYYSSWTLSFRGKNKPKTKPICFYPVPTLRLYPKVGAGLFENRIKDRYRNILLRY
jgi:hypothetical protein